MKMGGCEDEKMFYRFRLLEEPCAQTLSGIKYHIFIFFKYKTYISIILKLYILNIRCINIHISIRNLKIKLEF